MLKNNETCVKRTGISYLLYIVSKDNNLPTDKVELNVIELRQNCPKPTTT